MLGVLVISQLMINVAHKLRMTFMISFHSFLTTHSPDTTSNRTQNLTYRMRLSFYLCSTITSLTRAFIFKCFFVDILLHINFINYSSGGGVCLFNSWYKKLQLMNHWCCGLYYIHMTIINDDSSIVIKWSSNLIDAARGVIYDCHMFKVQATHCPFTYKLRFLIVKTHP